MASVTARWIEVDNAERVPTMLPGDTLTIQFGDVKVVPLDRQYVRATRIDYHYGEERIVPDGEYARLHAVLLSETDLAALCLLGDDFLDPRARLNIL
jgi:hypothetical protein